MAIIGGGGAIGRLFARLFCSVTRELYLIDHFDSEKRPGTLAKSLDDVERGATQEGWDTVSAGVTRTAPDGCWVVAPISEGRRTRALLALRSKGESASPIFPSGEHYESLPDLFESLKGRGSECTVFAGLPDDAQEILKNADVVLLALGFERTATYTETIRFYAPHLRPGALVVDLGSTKTQPLEVLAKEIDPCVDVLGAHPLFGPTVIDLTGLIVAVMDGPSERTRSHWTAWFLAQLARLKMLVTPTTADEHDDAMAFVQALAHFALLSFAYTFVRLNRDPADLLAFRTPVFEPLLYLAARVAYLARSTPETYRSIQTHSTRPDARLAFLEAAKEVLAAIEQSPSQGEESDSRRPDRLVELFQEYGGPWSPDGRDRREAQRREHFLEMGTRLVDDLNQLRQHIVAAAGEVRAIEERRHGQTPRIVVGIVDLDLLAPGKQDVASRVRLRPLNLVLGSTRGEGSGKDDSGRDTVIPLARARILSDIEFMDWLLADGQLVEKRSYVAILPSWFDRDVLQRLLKGFPPDSAEGQSRIWDVDVAPLGQNPSLSNETYVASITFSIVVHPADLVRIRRAIQLESEEDFRHSVVEIDDLLDLIRQKRESVKEEGEIRDLEREKDQLKRRRKGLIDQRMTSVDREVRRQTRILVHQMYQGALDWINQRGASPMC